MSDNTFEIIRQIANVNNTIKTGNIYFFNFEKKNLIFIFLLLSNKSFKKNKNNKQQENTKPFGFNNVIAIRIIYTGNSDFFFFF